MRQSCLMSLSVAGLCLLAAGAQAQSLGLDPAAPGQIDNHPASQSGALVNKGFASTHPASGSNGTGAGGISPLGGGVTRSAPIAQNLQPPPGTPEPGSIAWIVAVSVTGSGLLARHRRARR